MSAYAVVCLTQGLSIFVTGGLLYRKGESQNRKVIKRTGLVTMVLGGGLLIMTQAFI